MNDSNLDILIKNIISSATQQELTAKTHGFGDRVYSLSELHEEYKKESDVGIKWAKALSKVL